MRRDYMGNMQRDPEPDGPSYDRLVYWFTGTKDHSTDSKARLVCKVLLADAHWAVDEIRAQRKRIAELEANAATFSNDTTIGRHIAKLAAVSQLFIDAEDYDAIEAAKQAARDVLGPLPAKTEGATDA